MLSSLRMRMGDRGRRPRRGLDELAELGVAAPDGRPAPPSQDAKAGKLAIDDAKLSSALAADPDKVRAARRAASRTGLARPSSRRQTGTVTGAARPADKSADAEVKRITAQADRAETRLAAKEKRLKAQFAAMESALLNAQTQSAWLSGQLSALSR